MTGVGGGGGGCRLDQGATEKCIYLPLDIKEHYKCKVLLHVICRTAACTKSSVNTNLSSLSSQTRRNINIQSQ